MENTERKASAAANADLDHEAFMKDKGITTIDLPEKLQKADEILKEAKKNDFEAANEASQLLVASLQESIYEINESIEQIGETLTDHEQRIEALEEETPTNEVAPSPSVAQGELIQEVAPQRKLSNEEQILEGLYASGTRETNKAQLKLMGFNVGFFSKLSIRGATYGNYQLVKKPFEKTYQIVRN